MGLWGVKIQNITRGSIPPDLPRIGNRSVFILDPHLHPPPASDPDSQRPLKAWEWIFSELYITTFNIFYQPLPSLLIYVSPQEVLLMWRVLWT